MFKSIFIGKNAQPIRDGVGASPYRIFAEIYETDIPYDVRIHLRAIQKHTCFVSSMPGETDV